MLPIISLSLNKRNKYKTKHFLSTWTLYCSVSLWQRMMMTLYTGKECFILCCSFHHLPVSSTTLLSMTGKCAMDIRKSSYKLRNGRKSSVNERPGILLGAETEKQQTQSKVKQSQPLAKNSQNQNQKHLLCPLISVPTHHLNFSYLIWIDRKAQVSMPMHFKYTKQKCFGKKTRKLVKQSNWTIYFHNCLSTYCPLHS